MEAWTLTIGSALLRTALVQLIASGVIALLMRSRWQDQPKTCRLACFLVLLQGWMLVPLTIALPWYDPSPELAMTTSAGRETIASRLTGSPAWEPRSLGGTDARTAVGRSAADSDGADAWRTTLSGLVGVLGRTMACIWLAGTACSITTMVLRYRKFVRRLPGVSAPCDAWLSEWDGLLRQHCVRHEIRLFVTRREGPMLCYLPGGPAVLVPADLWRELTPAARRLILRHELSHYLRGDLWKSLLARVLALPQWFHPGAWYAVRMFDQCSERLCDERVASEAAERVDYARALAHLAALRIPVSAVGACAHSHPLVERVRFLLASPKKENGLMRRAVLLALTAALCVAGAVRVELVAKDVTYTKESVKAKMDELDQTVAKLAAQTKQLKEKAAAVKERVEAQISKAKEVYQSGNSSDAMRRCEAALRAGDEAQQLDILAAAKSPGEEGLVLLGMTVGHSSHASVRRKALQTAFEVGVDAAPVFAYAFETLPAADRIFLAERLVRYATPECIIGLAALVQRSGPDVQDAAIRLAAASRQRLLLFAALGQAVKDQPAVVAKLVEKASQFQGEDGLVALYALAKYGDVGQKITAVTAASERTQEGLPVLAAGFECPAPEVRAAVVRAAKTVGGELADQGIQQALQDPDAGLRQVAEKALRDTPATK